MFGLGMVVSGRISGLGGMLHRGWGCGDRGGGGLRMRGFISGFGGDGGGRVVGGYIVGFWGVCPSGRAGEGWEFCVRVGRFADWGFGGGGEGWRGVAAWGGVMYGGF